MPSLTQNNTKTEEESKSRIMRTIQDEKQNAGFNPSRLAALFAPKESSRQTWIEVFIITLGTFGICTFFEPNNPLLIGMAFPWLWLAPTVLALRYGSLAALASATILLVIWFFLKLEGQHIFHQKF